MEYEELKQLLNDEGYIVQHIATSDRVYATIYWTSGAWPAQRNIAVAVGQGKDYTAALIDAFDALTRGN